MKLSTKSLLICDNGLYTFLAPFMARYYGKVYYHSFHSSPYQRSPISQIGKGMDGVEWVDSIWPVLDSVDVIFFPDVYDGEFQHFLRSKGHAVCGSGRGEKMELDKAWFLEQVDAAGLNVPHTYLAEGLDDLEEYLKGKKGPLYMKNAAKHRGDWETTKHDNEYDTAIYLNHKRQELGLERSREIEILVQSPIDSECEAGIDGFMLNGEIATPVSCGFEIKDKGLVARMLPEVPQILQPIITALQPIYRELGYQGPYSNEVRITKNKKCYPIDETCRCASPPTELICEMMGQGYAWAIYDLAHGKMPRCKYDYEYGAQVVLSSKWHFQERELHVGFSPDVAQWLKLKNCVHRDGQYYIVPNGNDGIFGSMVAVSNKSWQDAAEQVMARIEKLSVKGLEYDRSLFEQAGEVVENAKRFGINLD